LQRGQDHPLVGGVRAEAAVWARARVWATIVSSCWAPFRVRVAALSSCDARVVSVRPALDKWTAWLLMKSACRSTRTPESPAARWPASAARGIGADEIVPWWDYAKVMQGCTDYVKTHQ
jgi:hypothetical protein